MKNIKTPSKLQQACFDAYRNTDSDLAIIATAGSGKTTTLLGMLQYASSAKKEIFVSFSRAIVEELKTQVPFHIKTATLHSVGFEMIRKFYKGKKIWMRKENDKYFLWAMDEVKKSKGLGKNDSVDKKDYRKCHIVNEICSYARMTLTPFKKESLIEMACFYNIFFDEDTIELAEKLLEKAMYTGGKYILMDFVDMIYLPAVVPGIIDTKYDTIYLDEAQDTNKAQMRMIERMLGKRGRLISVGDDFQCIYGFSGADIDAFKRIRERPNTTVLPLNESYRCPKSVVLKANEINPDMVAHANAIEGEERQGTWSEIQEGDMVLSRTTKPLISLYFKLLEEGIKSRVVGKDFETGLLDLCELVLAPSVEEVVVKLRAEYDKLTKKLVELGHRNVEEHQSALQFEEKEQIINLILKKVEKTSLLISTIKDIFNENKATAMLMTIHRSKGLEAERVFIITSNNGTQLMPSKHATLPWQLKQERNLQFVARTRSKKSLIFIELND